MVIPSLHNYYSFNAHKLWQDVSDGEEEAQTEAVQCGKSGEGHGPGADRDDARISRGSRHQKKENGQAQAHAGQVAGRKLKAISETVLAAFA
jgi:hypothetical protein